MMLEPPAGDPEAANRDREEPSERPETVGAHARLLARVELFSKLDRVALAQLVAHVDRISVRDGTEVCRQGEPADSLYIVASGRFRVLASSPDGGGEIRLATLFPGDYFGEMALLTDESRSATVRADGQGEVLRLQRARFLELFRGEPSVVQAVVSTLVRRLRQADQAIVLNEQLVGLLVERKVAALFPEQRRGVLEASVLGAASPEALRVLFGEQAEEVGRDLREIGDGNDPLPAPVVHALRDLFHREVGTEQAQRFARQAGQRLADARCWQEALGVLARYGPQRAFVDALGRALRDVPPLEREQAIRWVERLTDEEAAHEAEVASLRAWLHEQRGDPDAGVRVLRRALANALVSRDAGSGQRLAAEAARLARLRGEGGAGGGLLYGLRAPQELQRRPTRKAVFGVGVAVALVAFAIGVGDASREVVFLCLIGALVALLMSQLVADFAVALGLAAAWVIAGLVSPRQAVAGFASMDWVFVLALLGLAAGVARSGLLFRIGLVLVRRMPRGLFWQAGTLLLTGVVLAPILPQNKARAALTAPLALAVAQALRLRDHEPAAAVLGLAAWIGSGPMMFLFINGSTLSLLAWSLLPETSRARFDWIAWLVAAAPLGLFVGVGALAMLFVLFRPGPGSAPVPERVDLQLALLGPFSAREWTMMGVLFLTIAGWFAAPALQIHFGAIAAIGLLAAAATGNFDRQSFQELDWGYLIFYGVALSIASVVASVGLDRLPAGIVGGGVASVDAGPAALASPLLFVLGAACITFLVRLAVPQNPGVLLLGLALIPVAPAVGVEPWVAAVTILATSSMWFLPPQTTSYLVAYSACDGRLFSHAQASRAAFGHAAVTLTGLALSVPYWHLLGLL